jgi:ubiquinone/menaquinone biosynthesis C-methylase UbiE
MESSLAYDYFPFEPLRPAGLPWGGANQGQRDRANVGANLPLAFREFEREGWQNAAETYHDYWGELTQQSVEPLLDALAVNAGGELLDVACGPGYVAAAAAKRGARAAGVDFSEAMIGIAAQLHPLVEFREGDAEHLPFAADRFSAIAINYGIHHLSQPMRALREARRVLRPGGRVAFTVWATTDVTKGGSIVYDAMKQHGTLHVPLPPAPPLWRLDKCADACRVLREAGFEEPIAVHVAQTWRLALAEDFFRAFYDGSVRTKALLRAQTAPALIEIRRTMNASLKSYERAGRIEIPMAAVLVFARKPRAVY